MAFGVSSQVGRIAGENHKLFEANAPFYLCGR
jgi:hypothetical protein